jgi:hypothetical protein
MWKRRGLSEYYLLQEWVVQLLQHAMHKNEMGWQSNVYETVESDDFCSDSGANYTGTNSGANHHSSANYTGANYHTSPRGLEGDV